jgi:alcohol dehydrogenase, propanol-preferring
MQIPNMMKAMILEHQRQPLQESLIPIPSPGQEQVLVKVHACGVCRTDLHVVDGDLPSPKPNLIPGHEIVGSVAQLGEGVIKFKTGDRIGVPWLGYTDGTCKYCRRNQENLCDYARFTGYTIDGGYAEYMVADQHYCFPISKDYNVFHASPLLCAGLIGYRSYRMTGNDAVNIGFYGYGASAHIIAQVAAYEGKRVYAFTKPGDIEGQKFAKSLGAFWAGDSTMEPPEKLDAAIIFAPVGPLVPTALEALVKGGVVVCAGIHMSDIPSFPYHILWGERMVRSVANLTRRDGEEMLAIAPKVPVKTEIELFELNQANEALAKLRSGALKGAAVLKISEP